MKLLLAYILFFQQITFLNSVPLLVPNKALAQELTCEIGGVPAGPAQMESWFVIGDSVFMSAAWSCVSGVFQGAWEATGGAVIGIGECVWSPIECAENAKKAFNNAYSFFKDITNSFNQMFASLSQLSAQDKAELICSIIGGVGTDVLIAVLTAGAGSGKVALTLSKLGIKMSKLASLLKRFAGLPMRVLGKLSDAVLDKMKLLMNLGYKDDIMRSLAKCAL